MKGYAILCIVLHNLLHLVGPLVKENEFYYNYNYRAYWMWDHLSKGHENLVGDILSFFGWYGVPVFIFLSGFGITKKYDDPKRLPRECSWWGFLGHNVQKLWLLMAPIFVCYLIVSYGLEGKVPDWSAVLCQLTFTINFLCAPKSIEPGVYWYFGLTLQLYIVYRLFFFRKSDTWFWINLFILTALSLGLCWGFLPDARLKVQPEYEYFSHNCIRWFLPFFMGVLFARYGGEGKDRWWVLLSGLVLSTGFLIACSFQQQLWLFTPLFAVMVSICFSKLCLRMRLFAKAGVWLGGLSAYLFAAHPVVRLFFANGIVQNGQLILDGRSWLLTLLYLVVAILFAMAYRWFSAHYFTTLCEKMINRSIKTVRFKKND